LHSPAANREMLVKAIAFVIKAGHFSREKKTTEPDPQPGEWVGGATRNLVPRNFLKHAYL